MLVDGPLLERSAELERLGMLLAAACQGRGALVVIEGPPGIGKTRLLETLRAHPGIDALSARGGDLERDLPFGVVRQLFERRLRRAGERERRELLDGAAQLSASVLLELEQPTGGPADRSSALLHGLYWLTSNLAEREPLLLCIDDAHWSDPASLHFLHYLARRVGDLPLLLAVGLRPAEAEAHGVHARLRTEPSATVLRPSPLSGNAVAELVRARLGDGAAPQFCDACHAATAGNPFLLRELLTALESDGVVPDAHHAPAVARLVPQAVSHHVLARLVRLPAAARELARAVALLGSDVELEPAAALAVLDADAALVAADTLAAAELLRPGIPLEFAHPLVREAIYADLRPSERAVAHARAARLLERAGAPSTHVAAQLIAATPIGEPWALRSLRDAAAAALADGAAESAVSSLERALLEPLDPALRGQLVFELGQAEALVAGPAATARLAQALRLTAEPTPRARIAELLARRLNFDARPAEAVAVCRRALTDLADHDPELRSRLESELLNTAIWEPSLVEEVADLLDRTRQDADSVAGFGARATLALATYHDARAGMPAEDVTRRALTALADDELLAADNGGPAFILASVVLALTDPHQALRNYATSLERARATGNAFAFAAGKSFSCQARTAVGELADAIADGGEGLEATEAYGVGIGPAYVCAFLADALMEHGELDEAQRVLDRAGAPPVLPDVGHWHWFMDARARLRLLRGDVRGALEETLRFARQFEALGGRNPSFMPWRSRAALCLTQLGEDPRRARALAEEEVERAEAFGAPRALGRALRVCGLVTRGAAGAALLADAVDVLEPSPARLELAYALFEQGAALRRAGERERCRASLRRAVELAHACGAIPLRDRALAELLASGARPRRMPVRGIDGLTPSERRIAAMAADGLSNREIAAALFLSLKTVEMHLTRVYRHLELRSRAELPAALAAERKHDHADQHESTSDPREQPG